MATQEPSKKEQTWLQPPPVCEALLPIDLIRGQQNLNDVWQGEVLVEDGYFSGQTQRSVFKHLNHPGKLAVEMACSLVGLAMGNKMPLPCLVRASPDDLPGLRTDMVTQGELLLFGCNYVDQDAFFEQLTQLSDETLDNAVWNSFCADAPKAAKAAALDELIANWDRHSRNMRYDGKQWWLIDHDNSMGPTLGKNVPNMSADFKAHNNHVANQLKHRRPADHAMDTAARLSAEKKDRVLAMAAAAGLWTHSDPAVVQVWRQTAELIELLARRLPMLQQLLGERIGTTSETSLQWTPTPPPAPSGPAS